MGRYVDLHSYNYLELLQGIMDHADTNDRATLRSILTAGGCIIGDRYIILNNEHVGEFNAYFTIPQAIDAYFNVEDTFGKVFCTFDDKFSYEELPSNCDPVDELLEALDHTWVGKKYDE